MKRLTVDTELSFCDIAQCDSIPGGSFCEDGRCDQRRCYEKLREYERSDLEPETLRKAQGLLKKLSDCYDQTFMTYAEMCLADAKTDKQIWFTQGKVDERLKKACGKYFAPWDERYR